MRTALAFLVLSLSAWLVLDRRVPPAPEAALRELARRERDRKPYAGDLAPAAAGGYRFGAVRTDENGMPLDLRRGFAYYAVPQGKGRTYLVDQTGTVYAKDTGGEAPGWWPASDPTAKGWVVCGE